jgi:hypothetical protein
MPDPPYAGIADLLKSGRVVPFLGAGVNHAMRPPGAEWDYEKSTFPPDGKELSRFLARWANFPSEDDSDITDLSKVSSYFVDALARTNLRKSLRDIFNRDYAPSDIHTYLAEQSRCTPLLIVTTNYDDLTERAFNDLELPYDLVTHPADHKEIQASVLWWKHGTSEPEAVAPNKLYIDLKKTTVIYKMHGTMSRLVEKWDNYVITEEDYVDFLSQMMISGAVPMRFMNHFRTRHFLFLGYGLKDWNLRVMLRTLKRSEVFDNKLGSPSAVLEDSQKTFIKPDTHSPQGEELPSWAIQHNPSVLEKHLWDARRVKIYNVDIGEFVKRLRNHKI